MSVLISILAVGLLVFLHELGHFLAARLSGMQIIRFSLGFGSPLVSIHGRNGTVFQVGWLPLGGYVQIRGMNPIEKNDAVDKASYSSASLARRFAVAVAGPATNLIFGWMALWLLFSTGRPIPLNEPVVGEVLTDGSAFEAGIRPGDRIQRIDGLAVATWADLVSAIHQRPGLKTRMDILRPEQGALAVDVTPRAKGTIGLIGILPVMREVKVDPIRASWMSAVEAGRLTAGMARGIIGLVRGNQDNTEVLGPVGIIEMAAGELDAGMLRFIGWLAVMSLMLFLFNLLPLPALDGGRLVFLGIEALLRRPLAPRVEAIVHTAGFFLILGLIAVVTVKDIINLD